MSIILDSIKQVLPSKRKQTMGGWESFNAPCCHHRGERPDTRRRGGIKFPTDGFVFHCFNCGFKAGWQPGKTLSSNTKLLFKWLGFSDLDVGKLALEALRGRQDVPGIKKLINLQLTEVELPEDCLPITQWIQEGCTDQELVNVIEYILSRNLTLDDYPWHWSSADGYRDRAIIPFYYEGKIVGWTGRKIVPGKPKYLSHSQQSYVFNIDRQTWDRKFVIVVEGQFDAIAIDGISIMTNEPNEAQVTRINSLAREVIVVPDHDRPGAKILNHAIKNDWNVSLPPWGEDVNDVVKKYGKLYTLSTILHYKETNKTKIELLKKKLERIDE